MPIPPCAAPDRPAARRAPFLVSSAQGFVALLLLLLPASFAAAADPMVVRVVLNGVEKGDCFVRRTDDGDFFVRSEDLAAIGLRPGDGPVTTIDGEPHRSLRSIAGVSFAFDEERLTLSLDAAPALLPTQTIDFQGPRRGKVLYPSDNSFFANYRVGYTAGDSPSFRAVDVTAQAGARIHDWLALTDFTYTDTEAEDRFTRLQTSATRDWRETMQRLVVGDFVASSGDVGGAVNMGGVSFSKVYRIDPYFFFYPLANVAGVVTLPSDAEIYLNGTRLRSVRLAPGEFTLRDISSYGGLGAVTVSIKDPFGREERLIYPFYFTDVLLRAGLHEYSYNAGAVRKDFGIESNRYGDAAFLAFHRYGVNDSLTAGVRAEAQGRAANLGPTATVRLGPAGIVSAAVSGSVDEDGRGGGAALAAWTYQDRTRNARAFWRGQTDRYFVAGEENRILSARHEAGAGVGYGTGKLGHVALDGTHLDRFDGPDRTAWTLTYTRNLGLRATLTAWLRRISEVGTATEGFAGFVWYLWKDGSFSAGYRRTEGTDTASVQLQKNAPVGEGYGFRASVERRDGAGGSRTAVDPFLQYNGRRGIYTAEYRGEFGGVAPDARSWQLSASGAVAYVDGAVGLTRPVTDSFGLVRVGSLEGVRVYRSNQEVGRTDRAGRVFVPDLASYYENQININDKDIPFEYAIGEVVRYVSPPLRSGSVVPFEVKRLRAVTGYLKVRRDGSAEPLEYRDVELSGPGGASVSFPTAKGGEFYVEDPPPGRYTGSLEHMGKVWAVDLTIPESDEIILELGEVICEEMR